MSTVGRSDSVPQRHRVTLRQLASAAGVSVATVSRALRDDPQISERMRENVKRIAAELQYIPNATARSLASRASHLLGLIVPDVTDPVHGQVVSGFETTAAAESYTVFVSNSRLDTDIELRALQAFAANQVAGIAVVGSSISQASTLSPAHDNLVFVNPQDLGTLWAELPYGVIGVDDAGGAEEAIRAALEFRHRRIGFVNGPMLASGVRRRQAAQITLASQGESPLRIIESEGVPMDEVAARIRREGLDAVFCFDDQRALRLLDALRYRGIRVPEDVGVIGFDDIPQAAISNPRLTTVSVPYTEMGMLAAQALIRYAVTGEATPSTVMPVHLVLRESIAARSDAHVGLS